ncbi:eukaryotic translation initiation factor 4E-binding protein Mextli isoform X2 [Malaya genurostris]|uniref:eukaryotic translation initiation factor 4E-binding protein Mextli isoform X2 n=1 Tax=Malaya genurostris TaxID=325434 RepID=UPI0026F3DDEB|nr:eukaryotic translation initiation factor 4E-binding protein Mextli isoform X2 [Malaya genurostris]
MSQISRTVKNLEPPRPLKATLKQSHGHVPVYEVQSIEELITLTENVAASLNSGCNSADGMNALLANLRLYGPQLENVSKDTLDRAFVIFRNASQDERLNIMTRLNLLELIELRAKSWQVSDGINTYYKHKATNVEPDVIGDSSLLSTSPPGLSLGQQMIPSLSPGELIRTSGKFPKPTKIPGKTYCKDEIVIRNADSGKVNPGAKERLVQITGPNEEKINYAKQLIEDTIRRNASPVRLETSQDGSCSSLASSASDEMLPRRPLSDGPNSLPNNPTGQRGSTLMGNPNGFQQAGSQSGAGLNLNLANSNNGNLYQQQQQQQQQQHQSAQYTHPKLARNGSQNLGQQSGLLLHSLSSNDASLGEYKYTVSVGRHNVKITGECFDLVRVAKLVLDDYFSSNEFLAAVEMGFDLPNSLASPVTPMPGQHQLITGSPFVDSGVGLDAMAMGANCIEVDDDVFIVEPPTLPGASSGCKSGDSSSSSSSTLVNTSTPINNGLSRSRRSHFSRKDSAPDGIKDGSTAAPASNDDSTSARIVHEYERLIYYSKSPHSWALPRDWLKICDKLPYLVRNKVNTDREVRKDGSPTSSDDRDYSQSCTTGSDCNSCNNSTLINIPTNINTNNKYGWSRSDTNNNNTSTSEHNDTNNDYHHHHQQRRAQYIARGFLSRHATVGSNSFDMATETKYPPKHGSCYNLNSNTNNSYQSSYHQHQQMSLQNGGGVFKRSETAPFRLVRYKSID